MTHIGEPKRRHRVVTEPHEAPSPHEPAMPEPEREEKETEKEREKVPVGPQD